MVHFWKLLHNFAIDGNQNFFDKLSAKKFSWIQSTKCCSRIVSGSTFGGQAATGHWPEYRLSTTVQASAPACCLSLPSCGFPLLSPLACCCCYLHGPPPSLAAQVSLAPPPSVMWWWPPRPARTDPPTVTGRLCQAARIQLRRVGSLAALAVGDLYPHPVGLACHRPAWLPHSAT